jgi:hypothetical protein
MVTERAAAVTVPAHADVQRLRAIGVRRPIEVVPVPVDGKRLPRASAIDPLRLVLVGRLMPKKGVDVAISAMTRLPHYHLLVGDGELRSELEALARRMGVVERVRFAGMLPIDDVLRLVASAFALVHPSRLAPDGKRRALRRWFCWRRRWACPSSRHGAETCPRSSNAALRASLALRMTGMRWLPRWNSSAGIRVSARASVDLWTSANDRSSEWPDAWPRFTSEYVPASPDTPVAAGEEVHARAAEALRLAALATGIEPRFIRVAAGGNRHGPPGP